MTSIGLLNWLTSTSHYEKQFFSSCQKIVFQRLFPECSQLRTFVMSIACSTTVLGKLIRSSDLALPTNPGSILPYRVSMDLCSSICQVSQEYWYRFWGKKQSKDRLSDCTASFLPLVATGTLQRNVKNLSNLRTVYRAGPPTAYRAGRTL